MKRILILVFIIISSWNLLAQENNDSLSLNQLLDNALEKHHLLQANEKNTLIKQAEIEILKTNYQPTISASASFSYWNWLMPNKQKLLGGNISTDMYTDIYVNQTLYDWGENKLKKSVVEQEIKLNKEVQKQIRNTIIWGISNVYFEALKAKSEIAARQNSLQQLESQQQYAQNLQKIGKASRVDILKIQVQISVEEKNLQKAQNDFQGQLIEIKRLSYLGEEESIAIEDISGELYNQTQNKAFNANALYSEIRQNHPELAAKDQIIGIEAKQKELFELQNQPEIFSYGIASWEHAYIPFGDNFNYNIGVGIRYTIPHWGGSSHKTQMVQSDYRMEQMKDEKNQALLDIKKEIDLALNRIQDIKAEITNNKKIIKMATETLNNASVKYQAGQGSIIDILDAQEILTDATIEYEKSTIAYLQEMTRLHYLTGNDDYPF